MNLQTLGRLLMGVLFVSAGSVKITRIGQAIVPDTHKQMAKDFGKFLRVSPFKTMVKVTSLQYMHFVGGVELLCGFLLLTNNLTSLASLTLAVVMGFAAHTHYKLKDPTAAMAFPLVLMAILLFVATRTSRAKKEKEE